MLMLSFALLLLGFTQAVPPTQSSSGTSPSISAAAANPSTPTDPEERLQLGWKLNGLQETDGQPWHLKASYEVFSDGKSKDKGTFEEWWISEKQYKLIYQGSKISQVEYGTDHGIFHSGTTSWPLDPLNQLRPAIFQPIPAPEDISDWAKQNLYRKFDSTDLPCTAIGPHLGSILDENSISYCFDPQKPILLYTNTSRLMHQTSFHNFLLFEGRYIARDIQLYFAGKPSLTIHIDTLESLSESSQLLTTIPPDAIQVTKRITLSSVQAQSNSHHLIKKIPPQYPAEAEEARIQGTVVLAATISKEGHIQSLRVLSGPQMLRQASLDAVRQWTYKPYLLNGEPVEVDTEINVVFSMHSR